MKNRLVLSFVAVGLLLAWGGGSLVHARVFDPCSLLRDTEKRSLISGALEIKLMLRCGEITVEELTERLQEIRGDADVLPPSVPEALAVDILVNDPASDVGGTTQSETSIVVVGNTICGAWNDSGSDP
ncbi:MAG: hypothetical protein GTO12_21825, partial [Proteobacteria bacterium]|nr:hypothetical protein [Pseudomonadota bacterium]